MIWGLGYELGFGVLVFYFDFVISFENRLWGFYGGIVFFFLKRGFMEDFKDFFSMNILCLRKCFLGLLCVWYLVFFLLNTASGGRNVSRILN